MPGRVLPWLGRHAAAIMAAGIFLGLIAQDLAGLLRPLLPAAVAGLMILAYLRVRIVDLHAELRRPRLYFLGVGMLLIAPVLVWWLCTLLDIDLGISPLALMLRLAVFLGACVLVGIFIRRFMGAERVHRNSPLLDGISVLVLLIFAISIMDGIPAIFAADPSRILGFTLAAFALNLGLQIFSASVCLAFGRRRALTLGFISGNRSLGLLLAVLPASADPGLALFFILGQFPIYLLPAALAPLYRRLL